MFRFEWKEKDVKSHIQVFDAEDEAMARPCGVQPALPPFVPSLSLQRIFKTFHRDIKKYFPIFPRMKMILAALKTQKTYLKTRLTLSCYNSWYIDFLLDLCPGIVCIVIPLFPCCE